MLEGEIMLGGQWSLLLLDLIGGGAVVVALAYGLLFRHILREMKRLAD